MKVRHHLTFFIFMFCCGIALFFSHELLLPDALTRLVFRSPQIDTIGHFISFFVLSWLAISVIKLSLLTTFVTLSFYAGLSELGQYYLGFRNGEFSDFFADVAGIVLYILFKVAYFRYRSFMIQKIKKSKRRG
ncbi:VanZ family protein [Colwellia sp. 20A7]|uniref:VanZ family protein n=1 Tax=Colwellia sp. 20A7 TaxID=2689569 RepID=UPI00135AF36A|nr:VanZ family protein [Colwellia sp. 20A7]